MSANAPIAISGTLKDLNQYALESGLPYSTLWEWTQKAGFPAIQVGKRWVVSPVHALQWFEARLSSSQACANSPTNVGANRATMEAAEGHGQEEGGKKPNGVRGSGGAVVGHGPVEGDGRRPPSIRSRKAA